MVDEFFGKSKGKKVRERKAEENNRKEDVFHGRVISIDVNTAAVEEKGALAAVYERSELPDEAPRLYVVVCHASLVPRRRYETFTIRYVTPFAFRISKIYRRIARPRNPDISKRLSVETRHFLFYSFLIALDPARR